MKKKLSSFLVLLVFLFGLSLLLYPTVSNYWNFLHQTRVITEYNDDVAKLSKINYDDIINKALDYNKKLSQRANSYKLTEDEKKEYNQMLNINKTGIMGYIEIPTIDCALPIYHGTNENTLQVAVGHLEWSSLPIGGESSHCVLSGHRGLPSAKLFTDLDKVDTGDVFVMRILDTVVTYEVDKISIVEPSEVEKLGIEYGKDYCTLVTCTPYGINSHRLLIRGHRIENSEEFSDIRVTADAITIEPLLIAVIIAVPVIIILFALILSSDRKKYKKKKKL